MTAVQDGRAGRQRQTAGWLRERVVVVEAEGQALRAERDQLAGQVERLTGETRRLQARVGELEAKSRSYGERASASPRRSQGPTQPAPGRPGRKPGAAYGQQGRRPVPDRVVAVGLPEVCPHCGGALGMERIAYQWQEDLPVARPSEICRYQVTIGRCRGCHPAVPSRGAAVSGG